MPKPVLVGDGNPHGHDLRTALYPAPAGSAGARLCAHLNLTPSKYLRIFDRVTIMDQDEFGKEVIKDWMAKQDRDWFLLGSRVCGCLKVPFYIFSSVGRAHVLPHPSGRCRQWNEPATAPMARRFVAGILGHDWQNHNWLAEVAADVRATQVLIPTFMRKPK